MDAELGALKVVLDALSPLEEGERSRIIRYLCERFGITGASLMAAAGGRARAAKMTPEERSEVAKKAADARWSKKNTHPEDRP